MLRLLKRLIPAVLAMCLMGAGPREKVVLVFEVESSGKRSIDAALARRTAETLKKRLTGMGWAGVGVQVGDGPEIEVGPVDKGAMARRLERALTRSSRLELRPSDMEWPLEHPEGGPGPEGFEAVPEFVFSDSSGTVGQRTHWVAKRVVLTGEALESAAAAMDQYGHHVALEFNEKGAAVLRAFTAENINKGMAIVLDGKVISNAVIRTELSKALQVMGDFSMEEALDLASSLNSGSLPAGISLIETRPAEGRTPELASDADQVPPGSSKPLERAYAVVVGVESYRQDLPQARFAGRDARTVAEYLRRMGYKDENVVLLTDERAAKSDLEKYLGKWLGDRAQGAESVFFYFSGHGAPDPRTGDSFLVPFDGDPSFLEATGLPFKKVLASLASLKAARTVAVVDACFSGAGSRSVIAAGARPLALVAAPVVPASVAVLTASASDQIGSSYDEQGHGLFTYFLLKGLQGGADGNRDGSVGLGELFDFVRPRVEAASRKLRNSEQVPQLAAPGRAREWRMADGLKAAKSAP
ncbi:MAG: caspase family protein [Elusimicrobia bacterium]|nr:caspase family protein [Elusimicrobiota bacterium]